MFYNYLLKIKGLEYYPAFLICGNIGRNAVRDLSEFHFKPIEPCLKHSLPIYFENNMGHRFGLYHIFMCDEWR